MTARRRGPVLLVAGREVRERVSSRAVQISTAIMVVFVAAAVVLPTLIDDEDEPLRVGVTADASAGTAEVVQAIGASLDRELEVREVDDERTARREVVDGDLALVVTSASLLVDEEPDEGSDTGLAVAAVSSALQLRTLLDEAGVDPAEVASLSEPALPVEALNQPSERSTDQVGIVYAGTLIIYISILIYGWWITAGVTEEKATRVGEVLLGTVRPVQLLTGKVLGIGLVGVAQMVLLGATVLVAATAAGTDLPSGSALTIASLLLWFVLGYGLYCCLFAAAGSLTSRAEEAQSAAMPVTMSLVFGFVGAITALNDAENPLVTVLSFVPLSAPLTMPARAALGSVPVVEVVIAAALTVGSAVLLIRFAARVYSGGMLRGGHRLEIRQALRVAADRARN
ncbi:ABC transporter permease [soil metagenome]